MFDLLIYNAAQVVTVASGGARAAAGAAMRDLGVIAGGAVGVRDGRIAYVGPTDGIEASGATLTVNAMGKCVLPALVDPHTHLVFAGNRAQEFARRVAGESYAQIAASGGGINATVRATRAASKDELFRHAAARLVRCQQFGVATIEIKSGYGLAHDAEIRMLEVIDELREASVIDVVPTFLGAHTVPFDRVHERDRYIAEMVDRTIPEIAQRRLAEYCDVFIESGAFTAEEARRILEAARGHGLRIRIHADQLSQGGGAELAAEFGAASADHLDFASDAGLARMRDSGTVATLLPGVAAFLGIAPPDARRVIDAGVPVAIATDMNPGSCMSENMQLMLSLACMQMRMTMEEAITAATLNAAAALDRSDRLGSIEEGKQADLLVFDVPDYREIPYHFGINLLEVMVKNGDIILEQRMEMA